MSCPAAYIYIYTRIHICSMFIWIISTCKDTEYEIHASYNRILLWPMNYLFVKAKFGCSLIVQ